MEYDSDSNWFSVEMYHGHKELGNRACMCVCLLMWPSVGKIPGLCKLFNGLFDLQCFTGEKHWGCILASFSSLKCTAVPALIQNTIDQSAEGRETMRRRVCGCLTWKKWGRRCVEREKKDERWREKVPSIISFEYIMTILSHFCCNWHLWLLQ